MAISRRSGAKKEGENYCVAGWQVYNYSVSSREIGKAASNFEKSSASRTKM